MSFLHITEYTQSRHIPGSIHLLIKSSSVALSQSKKNCISKENDTQENQLFNSYKHAKIFIVITPNFAKKQFMA